jgi:hypothetical protein
MFVWIKRVVRLALGDSPADSPQSRRIRALYAETRRFSRDYDVPAYLRRARI